jgi:RNA 3'-terminal phosphate cyclase
MSALGTLKLVAAKKPQHLPTIQLRRNKLSNKLWEQIQLAKSQITGQPFVITRFRSVKDADSGLRRQVEMPKRVRPWWFVTENGKVCISIRYGSWTLELAKGKSSVEVGSADELVVALETIKQAVEAGELDAQIETASAGLKSGFKR